VDVLSDVLRVVSLRGALYFNGEFSAPWCVDTRPSAVAPYLSPKAGHLIIYHFLTEGRAYARLPGGRREELTAGDIVIFPHGDTHLVGNGLPEKPVDSLKTFARSLTQGLKVARFGGGGEITRIVCGYMACEPRLSEIFLAGLPKILKVHVASEPSGEWLAHSIRFSVDQAGESYAGSELVLARLSEVLFVETLRRYIKQFSLLCSAIALYAAIVITLDDRDKFVVHAPLHSKVASLSLVTALSKGTSLHLVRNMIAGPHGQGQDGEGGILLRRIHE
jgi:hypothetical protein